MAENKSSSNKDSGASGIKREAIKTGSTFSSGKTSKETEYQKEFAPYSPPSVSLPKGGGALRGMGEKFSTNPVAEPVLFLLLYRLHRPEWFSAAAWSFVQFGIRKWCIRSWMAVVAS